MNVEDELGRVKEELVQAIRHRDQAQSGWLTCRVCGARGEVHTCDYCHAARCRKLDEAQKGWEQSEAAHLKALCERNEAQAETRLIAIRGVELIRERDEAILDEKLLYGFLLDTLQTEEIPEWIAIDICRILEKRNG